MKILLANKFYYRRGGDCTYVLGLEQLLKKHGHEVAVFAMDYPENIDTPWNRYFPSEVKFSVVTEALHTFKRVMGIGEVRKKFTALLDDFNPDVVHLNNIHTQLSPVIAEIAHKRGIKVVWTVHDYKLLCPRYDCLKNGREICTDCYNGKIPVLKNVCMKNSLPASVLAFIEAIKWNRKRLESFVDEFICPSEFMREQMIVGGFAPQKLHHIANFIDVSTCDVQDFHKEDYYCYLGRLSHEKGVGTLIKAANEIGKRLLIIGDGPIREMLEKSAKKNVEFVGFKQWNEIKQIVAHAKFVVTPSEWNEVFGLVNIEALCLGTPVLAAHVGGIPELINETNGMTFKSGDKDDLKDKIEKMFTASFDYKRISKEASEIYDTNNYYERLIQFYPPPQLLKLFKNNWRKRDEYYCFLGRLSHEKGAATLIEAASKLPYKLVIIGGGPLSEELRTKSEELKANIEFVGFKQWDEIKEIVGKARFSVIPSEWYENNPLSVIEAHCLGTPVLGARIGGIPELICDRNGMTFESKNAEDLKEKIELMWNADFDYYQISRKAQLTYTAEKYYDKLLEIYN